MEQILEAVRTNADRLTGMFKPKEQAKRRSSIIEVRSILP